MKAWSTLRKVANENGCFARQVTVDNNTTPVFVLLDSNMQVKVATRSQRKIQEAIYSL